MLLASGVSLMTALACVALWLARTDVSPGARERQVEVSAGVIYAASFPDMAGVEQTLGRWQNKLLVINFWATWCAPCKEEIPMLAKLQQKYGARGLQVIGIAADSSTNVANFAQNLRVGYPLFPDEAHAIDFSRRLGNRMGLLPHTVVVKAGGETIHTQLGVIDEKKFETIIVENLPN